MIHTNGATEGGTVVLLAESSPKNAKAICQSFEQLAILERLVIVPNGVEALAYLCGDGKYARRLNYPFPGFVFMSSRLPILSGIAVLCCLRSEPRFERLPVVLLSRAFSKAQADTAHWLRAACCTQYNLSGELLQAMARSLKLAQRPGVETEALPQAALA